MRQTTLAVLILLSVLQNGTGAAERHMMQPRVPADKLDEARALKNPLPGSPETVEKGKGHYNDKGTCFNCHGTSAAGDGPVRASL